MTKLKLDKVIAFLGIGLLGYYLGLSLFRETFRSVLLWVLPPINTLHLPKIYPGILGAILAVLLAYLVYNYFIEKKPWAHFKRNYIIATCLLIILPLLTIGAFRVHAISYVTTAESTVPTSVRMSFEREKEIMFEQRPNSATGFRKYVHGVNDPDIRATIGQLIREMELMEVSNPQDRPWLPSRTLWLNYDINGKWYSKILSFDGDIFSESIGQGNRALYRSPELRQLLADLEANAVDIGNYSQAKIVNSKTIISDGEKPLVELGPEDFSLIINLVDKDNELSPTPEIEERFKNILENWVPQGDTHIYGIGLLTAKDAPITMSSFMVYDDLTGVLWFEDGYYQVDLLDRLNLRSR